MTAPGWRTSLVVEGFDLTGRRTVVTAGLLETANGDVQLAMRVDTGGGVVVILPLQAGSQLIVNLRELLLERVRLTGESL